MAGQVIAQHQMRFRRYRPNQPSRLFLASSGRETLLLIAAGLPQRDENTPWLTSDAEKRGAAMHSQPPERWFIVLQGAMVAGNHAMTLERKPVPNDVVGQQAQAHGP